MVSEIGDGRYAWHRTAQRGSATCRSLCPGEVCGGARVLKGELAATDVAAVLRLLADGAAGGCLHLSGACGEQAQVYLRGGLVYALHGPGERTARLGSAPPALWTPRR